MPDDDPQLATKAEAAISKKDVEVARRKVEIAAIERQAKIDNWNEYFGFVAAKLFGLAGLIVGGLEYLEPHILPFDLKRPDVIAGFGAALLFGRKRVLTLLVRVNKILEKMLRGKQ